MAEITNPRRQDPELNALEHELRDLGGQLDYPDGSSVASAVHARLDGVPEARARFWSRWSGTPRRAFATAAVALAVLFAGILALSPGTRTTIADRIGLPGIDVSTGDSPEPPIGGNLALGREVSLHEAAEVAGFPLLSPPSMLGSPDAVYVSDLPDGAHVTYLYGPRDELPQAKETGIGLLIMQFTGRTNQSFIQKQLGPDTSIEPIAVLGQPGFWIAGEPHVFFYQDAAGQIQEETIRLAGNVLLWEDAGRTLRIESTLDRAAVIAIAESMATSP
jgi:hypothetical protein